MSDPVALPSVPCPTFRGDRRDPFDPRKDCLGCGGVGVVPAEDPPPVRLDRWYRGPLGLVETQAVSFRGGVPSILCRRHGTPDTVSVPAAEFAATYQPDTPF